MEIDTGLFGLSSAPPSRRRACGAQIGTGKRGESGQGAGDLDPWAMEYPFWRSGGWELRACLQRVQALGVALVSARRGSVDATTQQRLSKHRGGNGELRAEVKGKEAGRLTGGAVRVAEGGGDSGWRELTVEAVLSDGAPWWLARRETTALRVRRTKRESQRANEKENSKTTLLEL
jgi:hypothetical protein